MLLEANARYLAIQRLDDLPPQQLLFINIDAMVYDMPATPGRRDVPPNRVVLEISERQPIVDNPALWHQVSAWREAGFTIALDDYGAGYMGLGALLKLHPNVLKLDRVIIQGVDRDPIHGAAVKNMVELGRDLDIAVIAEGVETLDEYWELRACGVCYMQGFLFGKPQRMPVDMISLPPCKLSSDAPQGR